MLPKQASESSVPALPAALARNGSRPAAVTISTGIAEQKYPTTRPPCPFQWRTSGLTMVWQASENTRSAAGLAVVCNAATSSPIRPGHRQTRNQGAAFSMWTRRTMQSPWGSMLWKSLRM